MTDDQHAFRTYAAAALQGILASNPPAGVVTADDIYKTVFLIADAMLAEEKRRFPNLEAESVAAKIDREYLEYVKQRPPVTIDPTTMSYTSFHIPEVKAEMDAKYKAWEERLAKEQMQTIDPLAGSHDADNEDKNGSYTQ